MLSHRNNYYNERRQYMLNAVVRWALGNPGKRILVACPTQQIVEETIKDVRKILEEHISLEWEHEIVLKNGSRVICETPNEYFQDE